jgi:Xaa-Pro aminopeptidase
MKNNLDQIRDLLLKSDLDCLLIGSNANRLYLSGFTGSDGWIIISKNKACLAVDFRYIDQAKKESPEYETCYVKGTIESWLPAFLTAMDVNKLGIEADHISVSLFDSVCSITKKTNRNIQVIPIKNIVESLRIYKKSDELESIKKACEIADKAIEYVYANLKPGITERQLAWELESFMRTNGSGAMPFEIIVAAGSNAAMPHAKPSDKEIGMGEPVIVDLGASYKGYCSDITRTFIIGEGNSKFDEMYNIVLSAQLMGLATINSGMKASDIDRIVRDMINKAGYGEQFGHGLGHGVGIETHELPRLGTLSTDVLEECMVFTVEPGIYLPDWGGIRIEDTVTIENGKLIKLTNASKKPLIRRKIYDRCR